MTLGREGRKQNEAVKIGAALENPQTSRSVVVPFRTGGGRTPCTAKRKRDTGGRGRGVELRGIWLAVSGWPFDEGVGTG
jgi:hypothetical protein